MGTVISSEMRNFDAQHGHNLNIVPVDYASAVVTHEKAALIMAVIFPLSMAMDVPREVARMVFKYGPHRILNMAHMLEDRGADFLPMTIQVISLMGGMALKDIQRATDEYPDGGNISGYYDPLAQWRMWRQIRAGGHTPHLRTIKGKGHGIAADGTGGGIQIVKSVKRWRIPEKFAA
jgi:hypothetical protein